METTRLSITPSEVIEYMYCPRFIYFMLYLKIPQHEEQNLKVKIGRDIHEQKASSNKGYLRKKLNVTEKLLEQKLTSERYQIHGIVDEILFLNDGTGAPLDYKFAEYDGKVYETYKAQIVLYGLLIEDNFQVKVNKGYIVYARSKNETIEVNISDHDREIALDSINKIIKIVEKGYFPDATKYIKRCEDCCYRNICIK